MILEIAWWQFYSYLILICWKVNKKYPIFLSAPQVMVAAVFSVNTVTEETML